MARRLGLMSVISLLACSAPSEIVVVVDREQDLEERLGVVRIEVSGAPERQVDPSSPEAPEPPWTLGVTGPAGRWMHVRVSTTIDETEVVQEARAQLVAGERRTLYLQIAARCKDECPNETQSCAGDVGCLAINRHTCPYTERDGRPEPCDSEPLDGGPMDAGPEDAGLDGGIEDPPCIGVCDVAAGRRHACAVVEGDLVRCWGSNDAGELGASGPPRGSAQVVPGLSDVIDVEAGLSFSCARTRSDVRCWGANDRGQLGSVGPGGPSPRAVASLRPAERIALGDHFACALAGDVYCWGDNERGQAAPDDLAMQRIDEPEQVVVPALEGPVEGLAAGARHACVWAGRRVWCWGDDARGQTAGSTIQELDGDVIEVAAGDHHTCALYASGSGRSIRCWGGDEASQAAGGTPAIADAVGLTAGALHTCALFSDGERSCWGENSGGSLAVGSLQPNVLPIGRPEGLGWVRLAAGDGFTCGMASSAVHCFGWDLAGAVGAGATLVHPSPVEVALEGAHVVEVGLGGAFTCALVALDDGTALREVRCWGRGAEGQLGRGERVRAANVRASSITRSDLHRMLRVGDAHACMLRGSTLTCWGRNEHGECGVEAGAFVDPPANAAGGVTVRALELGGHHTCAQLASDEVACWGDHASGQLGVGPLGMPTHEPQVVETLAPLQRLAAGDRHSCRVTSPSGADMACWGANDMGQLARVPGASETRPVAAPAATVTGIALGDGFTCRSLGDRIQCWGANERAQLGRPPSSTAPEWEAADVALGASPPPSPLAVEAGGASACAFRVESGRCWGDNRYGQLGRGTTGESAPAAPVALSLEVGQQLSSLRLGRRHGCAIVDTVPPSSVRRLFCWGSDEDGRLGQGRTLVFTTPQEVMGL